MSPPETAHFHAGSLHHAPVEGAQASSPLRPAGPSWLLHEGGEKQLGNIDGGWGLTRSREQ